MRQHLLKAVLLLLAVTPLHAQSNNTTTHGDKGALYQTVLALDRQLFDAANHCDYAKLTEMVDENLEFYHDKAGLMVGRKTFLESIRNNTCGKMVRELVPGSMEVYPIKDYGAMQFATHRFHHPGHEKEFPGARELGMTRFLDPGAAEWPVGEARFLHIWQLKDGSWKLTRVVSYDH
ncbi:MAG: nuclear transport factor 2 family protein [Acidobacteria bacterium]|nr:nuclear transport factor 2 family protein [Acidobacteriota bacterium]